jgi:hypothetical protein
MPDIATILLAYGPLGAIALAAWRVTIYLGHRLFDPPTAEDPHGGLVTRYFNEQSRFFAHVVEQEESRRELCRRHAEALELLRKDNTEQHAEQLKCLQSLVSQQNK